MKNFVKIFHLCGSFSAVFLARPNRGRLVAPLAVAPRTRRFAPRPPLLAVSVSRPRLRLRAGSRAVRSVARCTLAVAHFLLLCVNAQHFFVAPRRRPCVLRPAVSPAYLGCSASSPARVFAHSPGTGVARSWFATLTLACSSLSPSYGSPTSPCRPLTGALRVRARFAPRGALAPFGRSGGCVPRPPRNLSESLIKRL